MEHSDVVTLFHEFGHLVHHVLAGRHDWVRFSGVATEWDFVEAPSQMLEEWAWDADVLGIVRDQRSPASRSHATWSPACAQRTTSAAAMPAGRRCSTRRCPTTSTARCRPTSLTRVAELQTTYDVFPFVDGTHFHASFGHLAGYTSAYYTYMWSLVIAKDLFSAFDRDDLFAGRDSAALSRHDPGGRRLGRRRRPGGAFPRPALLLRRLRCLAWLPSATELIDGSAAERSVG